MGVATAVRERATRAGRPPRRAYEHYFIESDGLHSRIHLQNFWSTFWPDADAAACAHIQAFDASGRRIGATDRRIPPFGSLFLEARDLLAELRSDAKEGTVAIDLEPPAEVRKAMDAIPDPAQAEVKTPFWMAYYDDNESYMYVHSIDTLGGEVFGAPPMLRWALERKAGPGGKWRSWRLLDVDQLTAVQVVVINHSAERRATTVGVYAAGDGSPLWEQHQVFEPRAVHRLRVADEELAAWPERFPDVEHVRIGLDPLLTANGKPYVLVRYGAGALSVHHG